MPCEPGPGDFAHEWDDTQRDRHESQLEYCETCTKAIEYRRYVHVIPKPGHTCPDCGGTTQP